MGMYLEPFQAGNVAYCNRVSPPPVSSEAEFLSFFSLRPQFLGSFRRNFAPSNSLTAEDPNGDSGNLCASPM